MGRFAGSLLSLACMVSFVMVGLGCVSGGRVSTHLSIEQAHAAVRAALESAGYRELRDLQLAEGKESTRGSRPGTALQPFGLRGQVDYLPEGEDALVLDVSVSGFSLVPVFDWGAALRRQVESQIEVAERSSGPGPKAGKTAAVSSVPTAGAGAATHPLPPFTEQRHALIVGISQYQDSNFSSLLRARKDAEALAKLLASREGGNISSDRIHVLIDEKATRGNIIRELVKIGRETHPGDMIILYFACHAQAPAGEGSARYIIPFDGEMSSPEATALEKGEIQRRLDEAEAKRQVVVLDCCFAGPVTRGDLEADAFGSLQGASRAVLTSTKGSETALDAAGNDAQNSPFAAALLSALRGEVAGVDSDEDGRLTVQEIYQGVRLEVIRAAQQVGHRMTPQLYGSRAAELELVRVR